MTEPNVSSQNGLCSHNLPIVGAMSLKFGDSHSLKRYAPEWLVGVIFDVYDQHTQIIVARIWSIRAFDQTRCAGDQFIIRAAVDQLRNSWPNAQRICPTAQASVNRQV